MTKGINQASYERLAKVAREDEQTLINKAISEFPEQFGLSEFPDDIFRISPMNSYVSGGQVLLYTEIQKDGKWYSFAKGTPEELKSQIEKIAKVAQEQEYDINYEQISHRLQDLVEYMDPHITTSLDGVLENLTSIPPEQLTENDFRPLFQYFNTVRTVIGLDENTMEIYNELERKLYYMMRQELHISNSIPVDEY